MKRTKIFCIYYTNGNSSGHFIGTRQYFIWECWKSKISNEISNKIDELSKEGYAVTKIQIL